MTHKKAIKLMTERFNRAVKKKTRIWRLRQIINYKKNVNEVCSPEEQDEAYSKQDIKSKPCPVCNGSGWLWGKELIDPSEDTINDTQTKYTCDRCDGTGKQKVEQ